MPGTAPHEPRPAKQLRPHGAKKAHILSPPRAVLPDLMSALDAASDSDDSGILVEEITQSDSGILVEELTPSDDEGAVLVEEVVVLEGDYVIADATVARAASDSDDDAVVIQDVTHEEDSSDSDTESASSSDDDDLPVVEEVAHPRSGGPTRAPPSRVELAQAKEEKRNEGHARFARKRFKDAAKSYGDAIDLDPYDHTLYSNRALCFLELGSFEKARLDAEECTKLRPDFLKGHLRLARALRLSGESVKAMEACRKGLDIERNSRVLREEYALSKKELRTQTKRRAIQGDLHDLAAEMTPEERRWKALWAGQGHPTCVNNTNLERYIPDCPVDVSYDAEVSQELNGPDNLPRLESEDEADEDDLLLEEILERLKLETLLPTFEDEGLGPRSLLTCARLPELRPVLQSFMGDTSEFDALVDLALAQAKDCLEESWDRGAEAIREFPPANAPGLAYTYAGFSWRQRVREIELRVLLPPGCAARDLSVEVKPRRITVKVKRSGLRVWPYERNSWTSIVDVGPQLPGAIVEEDPAFDADADDALDALDEVAPVPPPTSATAAFRAAQARPVAEGDDSDLEVEELSLSDDDLEVEELPLSDDDASVEAPRTLRARWVEGGLVLKAFDVSEGDVRAQIFGQTGIPPELQILECDGVVVGDAVGASIIDVREAASTAEAARLLHPAPEAEAEEDDVYGDAAPDVITLLDFPTARKLLVDESVWHVSKPRSCRGHALQAPVLVLQLAKFQSLEKGTAQSSAQAWWRTMFLGAGEDDSLRAPPAGFYKWK